MFSRTGQRPVSNWRGSRCAGSPCQAAGRRGFHERCVARKRTAPTAPTDEHLIAALAQRCPVTNAMTGLFLAEAVMAGARGLGLHSARAAESERRDSEGEHDCHQNERSAFVHLRSLAPDRVTRTERPRWYVAQGLDPVHLGSGDAHSGVTALASTRGADHRTRSNCHASIHGVTTSPNCTRTHDSGPSGVGRFSNSTITPIAFRAR